MINEYGTILKVLSLNANQFPEHTALFFEDRKLTWQEVDTLTTNAAGALIRKGVQKGKCVAIKTKNNGWGLIAILSVLKTGAAYLPLNTVYPESRLQFMCSNANVEITLQDDDIEQLSTEMKEELPEVKSDDLLAITYTSGSTGTPKVVRLLHRDAFPYALHYIKTVGMSEKDIMAMYVGLSFVVHIMDMYAWVLSGAQLNVIPAEMRLDIRLLGAYFNQQEITVTTLPTGIGKKFIAGAIVPKLRTVTVAGENLTPFTSLNKGLKVYNALGCTETAGCFTIGEVFPDDDDVNIGKEVDGIDVRMTDEEGQPVPDGDIGEIWVYLPDRIHKTGDLGKRDKNGNIQVIGRRDFQLNIRGYRIDPSEIEVCALRVSSIIETVVVERGGRLVLYFACESNFREKVSSQQLKTHLSVDLPPYMIPVGFVELEKLPRNANGKIDRASLPEPVYHNSVGEPLKTETEKQLAKTWGNILDMNEKRIYRGSGFSDLGGDSLSLLVLSAEIENVFNITVTPAELWEAETLRKQAQLIDKAKEFSIVFTFRATGSKEPLFFAHTANSGAEVYMKLANFLPSEQPFFAFEHYNLIHSEKKGIRELAQIYVDELIKLYPDTPCALGGWSFGGLISFEMALIMKKLNRPVKHLYLVDPQICSDNEKELYAELHTLPYYREYLQSEPLFERYRQTGHIERLLDNNALAIREISSYRPDGECTCPVTLFRMVIPDKSEHPSAKEQELLSLLWSLKKDDNGFSLFAKNLEIINIQQSHDRALTEEDSIAIIADAIKKM